MKEKHLANSARSMQTYTPKYISKPDDRTVSDIFSMCCCIYLIFSSTLVNNRLWWCSGNRGQPVP